MIEEREVVCMCVCVCVCVREREREREKYASVDGVRSACLESREIV